MCINLKKTYIPFCSRVVLVLLACFSSLFTLFSEFPYCFVRSHESKLSKAISQAKPLFNNIDSPSRPQDTLPGAKRIPVFQLGNH